MFFFIPYHLKDRGSRSTIPAANSFLVAASILVYFLGWSRGLAVGPGTNIFSIFTYAFAHADIEQLAVNMILLVAFGTAVNRRVGNFHYLALYLGSAVALGVFARLFCNGDLLGATGAIMAVIAACVLLLPSALVEVFYFALFPITLLVGIFYHPKEWIYWFIRWGRFEVRAVWGILFVPMLELWGLYWAGWNWTNVGHLFGVLCGVVGVLMLPRSISMRSRSAFDV